DPYRIWVSEIMLQQTRVDTVIPYFNSFINKFPTIKALAEAPEEEVLKSWEGLGYYSRARNLQAGARMVMEQHNGIMPTTKEEVAALKGVGPYTCGAIMSIAYNEPIPAVDGNVMRVISRFFALEDDIAKASTRVKLEKLVATMIPEGQARYFNQALMERSEERRVGNEWRLSRDWSSDVCSSDLPYTCGAIMSIAYNEPIPAVDGNVMRVISRFFALEDDIAKASTRVKLEKLVATMIPEGQARYFNQALME